MADDRCKTLEKGRFENQVFIRIDGSLHHVLAQAVGRREQNHITKPRLGIEAEHHPRAGQIGAHHALNADRKGYIEVIKAVQLPVGNGPVGEQ